MRNIGKLAGAVAAVSTLAQPAQADQLPSNDRGGIFQRHVDGRQVHHPDRQSPQTHIEQKATLTHRPPGIDPMPIQDIPRADFGRAPRDLGNGQKLALNERTGYQFGREHFDRAAKNQESSEEPMYGPWWEHQPSREFIGRKALRALDSAADSLGGIEHLRDRLDRLDMIRRVNVPQEVVDEFQSRTEELIIPGAMPTGELLTILNEGYKDEHHLDARSLATIDKGEYAERMGLILLGIAGEAIEKFGKYDGTMLIALIGNGRLAQLKNVVRSQIDHEQWKLAEAAFNDLEIRGIRLLDLYAGGAGSIAHRIQNLESQLDHLGIGSGALTAFLRGENGQLAHQLLEYDRTEKSRSRGRRAEFRFKEAMSGRSGADAWEKYGDIEHSKYADWIEEGNNKLAKQRQEFTAREFPTQYGPELSEAEIAMEDTIRLREETIDDLRELTKKIPR